MPYEQSMYVFFEARKLSEDVAEWEAQHRAVRAAVRPTLDKLDRHSSWNEASTTYSLTERTCRELLPLLKQIRRGGDVALNSMRIDVAAGDADAAAAEWFLVEPETCVDIEGSSQGLLEVKADRIKGREALRVYSRAVLVSERFVEFVKQHKLTGVEFLWCPDKGKYAATQWYTPFGTEFLSRGLDHPWFDPAKRGQYKDEEFGTVQPTDPKWMRGVNRFAADQVREDVQSDPPGLADVLRELRQMTPKYPLRIFTPLRVLRKFLPTTDFAYARLSQPEDQASDAYYTTRLCVNAAARKLLIEARLAREGDFAAIEVLDEAPPGAEVFDAADAPLPHGAWAPEILAKARAAEAKARAKHEAKPRPPAPVKPVPMAKLLPRLKRLLKAQGEPVNKGADPDAVAAGAKKIGLAMPVPWAELLQAIDGFAIDECAALDGESELRVAAMNDLPEEHASAQAAVNAGDPDWPATRLGVAGTDIGDLIFLDTAKLTADGDCPVRYVDHETLETIAAWPAISLFLADALDRSNS